MKVTAEEIPQRQVVLNIEAEPQEIEEFMSLAYRHLVQRTVVPGFRKGKAPRNMLERYLGPAVFMEEALNHLLPEMTDRAIKERALEIIAEPSIKLTAVEPVTFKATLSLRPSVKLGAYRELRTEEEKVEVKEEQVDKALEELRYNYAPWEPADRPVQFGDLLTLDAEGTQGDTRIMNDKGATYTPQAGLTMPLPGFSEQLVGVKKGESKEFTLSYPQDDKRPELAGKEFKVKVTVTEMKEKKLPALDDEFAKTVGQEFESLPQLRERIKTNLKSIAEAAARRRYEAQVLEAVVKGASMEYPPVVVEHEIDHLLADRVENDQSGRKLEEYLKRVGKTQEQIRDELKPEALERVTRSMVIGQVIQDEGIVVSDDEINAEIESMVKDAGERGTQLRQLFSYPQSRESLRRSVLTRKAVERLADIARGTAPVPESEALEKGKEEEKASDSASEKVNAT